MSSIYYILFIIYCYYYYFSIIFKIYNIIVKNDFVNMDY